jgi:hypothetical protein
LGDNGDGTMQHKFISMLIGSWILASLGPSHKLGSRNRKFQIFLELPLELNEETSLVFK